MLEKTILGQLWKNGGTTYCKFRKLEATLLSRGQACPREILQFSDAHNFHRSCMTYPLNCFQALGYLKVQLVIEAIGYELTKESKVTNNWGNYDVSII